MKINYEAILKKVESSPAVKKKIEDKKKKMLLEDGDVYQKVSKVADDIAVCLHRSIEDLRATDGFRDGYLGSTAVEALLDEMIQNTVYLGDGKYRIYTYFDNIHRESLMPSKYPQGVDNLADWLNSGYDFGHTVRGVWRGHGDDEIFSLAHRQGAHFTETAIKEFLGNYPKTYKGIKILDVTQESKNSR